jgi:hypothetical protein
MDLSIGPCMHETLKRTPPNQVEVVAPVLVCRKRVRLSAFQPSLHERLGLRDNKDVTVIQHRTANRTAAD